MYHFLLDHQEKVSLKDFFMPSLYKPLIIGSMLMVFQQFGGVNAVLLYDSEIFKSAGSHVAIKLDDFPKSFKVAECGTESALAWQFLI